MFQIPTADRADELSIGVDQHLASRVPWCGTFALHHRAKRGGEGLVNGDRFSEIILSDFVMRSPKSPDFGVLLGKRRRLALTGCSAKSSASVRITSTAPTAVASRVRDCHRADACCDRLRGR